MYRWCVAFLMRFFCVIVRLVSSLLFFQSDSCFSMHKHSLFVNIPVADTCVVLIRVILVEITS